MSTPQLPVLTRDQQRIKNRTLASILHTLQDTSPASEAEALGLVKDALFSAWVAGRAFGRRESTKGAL
jgi:hypothetical protein